MNIPGLPALRRADIKTHRFLVRIPDLNSMSLVGFRSVQGLDLSVGTVTVQEPGSPAPLHFGGDKGQVSVSLERGLDFDGGLSRWIEEVGNWEPGRRNYRKDLSVYFVQELNSGLGITLQVSRGFDLFGAFPVQYVGPVGNALRGDIAVERVQLIVSRIEPAPINTGAAVLNLI